MKPKKKDRLNVDESKSQFERLQADHEMFLQAFEKPTQIYRYLRSRSIASPILLQRNLCYMYGRSQRKPTNRKGFKVDSILDVLQAKFLKDNSNYSYKSEFMNVSFSGIFDQRDADTEVVQAEVEVLLMKICHKKRKDVSSPIHEVSLGKVQIPINPSDAQTKCEGVSIANQHFRQSNGHMVKSYTLLFRVTCSRQSEDAESKPVITTTTTTTTSMIPEGLVNGLCNGNVSDEHNGHNDIDTDEPALKRRRSNNHTPHPSSNHVSPSSATPPDPYPTLHGAELVIYDRHQRCLLTEGEYELVLQDLRQRTASKKQATWESINDGQAIGPFEVFSSGPTLKFSLSWTQRPLDDDEMDTDEASCDGNTLTDEHGREIIVPKDIMPRLAQVVENNSRHRDAQRDACVLTPSKRRRIFYQFLYNNNTRQQTEARDDLHCPWCSLHCLRLYPLLKHLRNFHPRFNFTYTEHPKGARIDVSINQCYDGAYVGNPQDLHSHIGYAFSRTGPVRRTPVTHVLVYRPKKPFFDLAEFMEPETETHSTRQIIQGHNRLYYHTLTHQPVRPCEMDDDSEDENDPLWLRQKTINMIDEFTDVNEGEKEVMKMWNLHVMHHNILGDCQISRACLTFVEEYGVPILQQNLVRNLELHLTSLYDFGLVRPETIYRTMMALLQLRNKMEALGHLDYSTMPAGSGRYELEDNLCQRLNRAATRTCVPEESVAESFVPPSSPLPTAVVEATSTTEVSSLKEPT